MTEHTPEHECPFCRCGRRAPVQASPDLRPAGTIAWAEHVEAWTGYAVRYSGQSADRIAERGGFDFRELQDFLGHDPTTWMPR